MNKIELEWQSIGHLLEDAAKKYPQKTLFIYEEEKLTFSEVDKRVNQVANALKDLGVIKDDKVGIMLPNGFEFPITWLALAKLGAVMIPTNIHYKEHDLTYILTNSEVSTIVIHSDYLTQLENVKDQLPGIKRVIVLGDTPGNYLNYQEITKNALDQFTIENIAENDLINIQYTSGTTGFPKGCMLLVGNFAHIKQNICNIVCM